MDLTSSDCLRAEFPIKQHCAFFNHAAVAPLPRRTLDAVQQTAAEQATCVHSAYPGWEQRLRQARHDLAALIGATWQQVAFTKNTTSGLLIPAQGIPWRDGDNVVISSVEFPANVYPWLALAYRGVQTRMVDPVDGRIRLDDIAAAMDGRTRAVSLSWVQYANGFRIDLAALAQLCHERGALCIVDAIQGLGAIPLDAPALGIDFLSADGHKWLLSVEGCGLLYVSHRAMEALGPVNVGWLSVRNAQDYGSYDLTLHNDARRYEEGSHNMIGAHALGASAALLLEVGPGAAWERIEALTDRLVEGLLSRGCHVRSPRGAGETSGIVSFVAPTVDPADTVARLADAGIVVCARDGAVRVAPHFYNDEDETDALLDAVS